MFAFWSVFAETFLASDDLAFLDHSLFSDCPANLATLSSPSSFGDVTKNQLVDSYPEISRLDSRWHVPGGLEISSLPTPPDSAGPFSPVGKDYAVPGNHKEGSTIQPYKVKAEPFSPIKVSVLAESQRLEDIGATFLPFASPTSAPLLKSEGLSKPEDVCSADVCSPDSATTASPCGTMASPEPSPSSAVQHSSPVDKRKAKAARKRQQNKDAAVRYRQRKQGEQKKLHEVCEDLRAENAELLRRKARLTSEIAYVRGLVEEVMKARKERAAAANVKASS